MGKEEHIDFPRTAEEIFGDYQRRRAGLLRALTDDVDDFYAQCDPEKENLVLYGLSDGSWSVDAPAEEVPPELPEPCLGINFARDGMPRRDWLALVAVHSDTWLLSVAYFYAVKLDANGRMKLFKLINTLPTLFEVVTNRQPRSKTPAPGASPALAAPQQQLPMPAAKRQKMDRPIESTYPSGKLLTDADIGPQLKGRQAELFWPDDKMWYLVEIVSINVKTKQAKVIYAGGEEEEMDLGEIVRDGHMALLPL